MSVQSRINKINAIAEAPSTREIFRRDKARKVYYVESIDDGQPYEVSTVWTKENGIMTIVTSLFSFSPKDDKLIEKLNNGKAISYHVLGALKFAARQEGMILAECNSRADAERRLRIGGQLIQIKNQGAGIVWAVCQPVQSKIDDLPAPNILRAKLDLRMRQDKENYID